MNKLLKDLDNVNNFDYQGIAYFWGHEYKHALRDATPKQRVRIQNAGLNLGIDFLTANKDAWYLIAKVLNRDVNQLVDIEEVA